MRVLVFLLSFHPKMRARLKFEKKNKFEALAYSFREKNTVADICFEFSSEGEFQQVAPLIDDALQAQKKIELVFFSPSVEKAIMNLAAKHPTQIRYLRFPFLRLFPGIQHRSFTHWVTAKTLVMVRYDLFPELLLWGMKPEHELKLVWFTFKKERVKGKGISFWKKLFLKNADVIIYASKADEELGRSENHPGPSFDFRIEQIRRRVEKRDEKFQTAFPLYPNLKSLLETYKREDRLLVGNAWTSDLFLLRDLPSDVLLVVVPHELSLENLNRFYEGLTKLGRTPFVIHEGTRTIETSNTILINKKGILCELYSDFGKSYVGGGFHTSIHSVLEPLVAGSDFISAGPMHDRSTEYDIALGLHKMTEVNTPEQFLLWLKSPQINSTDDKMKEFFSGFSEMKKQVISC